MICHVNNTINVNTNTLTLASNVNICSGDVVNLSALGANTYSWSNGSLFQNASVSPTISTMYLVSATDMFNCMLTGTVSVNVNPKPVFTLAASKSSVCKGETVSLNATSAGSNTYSWTSALGYSNSGSQIETLTGRDLSALADRVDFFLALRGT